MSRHSTDEAQAKPLMVRELALRRCYIFTMASRPRNRPVFLSIIPGVGQGVYYGALNAGLAILDEKEEGSTDSSEERSVADNPSSASLELHDGETEPFAMMQCPHCFGQTAFPLRLQDAPCEVCGGDIRAPTDATPRA